MISAPIYLILCQSNKLLIYLNGCNNQEWFSASLIFGENNFSSLSYKTLSANISFNSNIDSDHCYCFCITSPNDDKIPENPPINKHMPHPPYIFDNVNTPDTCFMFYYQTTFDGSCTNYLICFEPAGAFSRYVY